MAEVKYFNIRDLSQHVQNGDIIINNINKSNLDNLLFKLDNNILMVVIATRAYDGSLIATELGSCVFDILTVYNSQEGLSKRKFGLIDIVFNVVNEKELEVLKSE